MSSDVFDVVFVCTGNRLRSPLAEALFRREKELGEQPLQDHDLPPDRLAEEPVAGDHGKQQRAAGHQAHGDIIPAPLGGCPTS
jgi:hypothetical protein